MKKIITLIAVLSFSSASQSQFVQQNENPWLPPPSVPNYHACQAAFNNYMDCQPGWVNHGKPMCVEITQNYYQTLDCPAVFKWQARVNANAAAGNPPKFLPSSVR